jgi:hypothetical protein
MVVIFNSFDKNLLIHIITFLDPNEIYIFKEICKTCYNILDYINLLPIYPLNKYILLDRPLYEYNYYYNNITCYITQSVSLVKWAKTHLNFKYRNDILKFAARNGNLNVIKFLLNDGCLWDWFVYYEACQNGYFDIIKWCHKKRLPHYDNEMIFSAAAEFGDLKIIKWLYKNNFQYDENICHNAAIFNHLHVLKYFIKKGISFNAVTYNYAAENGNIKILKYLNHLSTHDLSLDWWDVKTCAASAEYGQLNTLKFLRKNNCPWDLHTTYNAASRNHVETLKWAIENGCPTHITLFNSLKSSFSLDYKIENVNIVY